MQIIVFDWIEKILHTFTFYIDIYTFFISYINTCLIHITYRCTANKGLLFGHLNRFHFVVDYSRPSSVTSGGWNRQDARSDYQESEEELRRRQKHQLDVFYKSIDQRKVSIFVTLLNHIYEIIFLGDPTEK